MIINFSIIILKVLNNLKDIILRRSKLEGIISS